MESIFTQPRYNIGMVGNVAHGKSTIVKALTGVETFKHSKEKERGITIRIGYANCKIFKCPNCPEPECYQSAGSKTKSLNCNRCQVPRQPVDFFSFIDCPGHESLMSTMLSGTTVMDYAILLIDGSQKCPQSQTAEHLAALEILQVKKIIIIQNKLDLIDENKAVEQYNDIKNFVKGTCAADAPIIPLSAQKKYNLDVLCEFIVKYFGPVNRIEAKPKMNIIRSFDVNKPGTEIPSIVGGVLGGSLLAGELRVGDTIEIRPGLIQRQENRLVSRPIITQIVSIKTDADDITRAGPGGLVGICTNLDPVLTRTDRMVGQVVGLPGFMPDVFSEIHAQCTFMRRVHLTGAKINKPSKNETVLLNISSRPVTAIVKNIHQMVYLFELKHPCCMETNEKFSISSKIGESWRLIGMGEIKY